MGRVAHLPKGITVLCLRRCLPALGSKFCRDLAKALRLFGDARFGSVELQKKVRPLWQTRVGIFVEPAHHHLVQQFNPSHGQARLDCQDHAVYGGLDIGETAGGGHDALGLAVQF